MSRKELYQAHLRSQLWQTQRKAAFARWGRFCNCCGQNDAVHVHHLNYRNLIDCIPEDLMPLCEECHNEVHARTELDQMARVLGDPMEKRRMVIMRLRAHTEKVVQIVRVEQVEKISKKERRRLKRERRRERERQALAQPEMRRANRALRRKERADERGPSEAVLKILARRFRVSEEMFQGFSGSAINSILHRDALPVFAKPVLFEVIAKTDPAESMTLTRADLLALRTDRNGFTGFTLSALGVSPTQPASGWLDALIGKSMPRAQYLRAMAGRTIYANASRALAV